MTRVRLFETRGGLWTLASVVAILGAWACSTPELGLEESLPDPAKDESDYVEPEPVSVAPQLDYTDLDEINAVIKASIGPLDLPEPVLLALTALENDSKRMWVRARHGRVTMLRARSLGGMTLAETDSLDEARAAVVSFLQKHGGIYGLTNAEAQGLAAKLQFLPINESAPLAMQFVQHHQDVPVLGRNLRVSFSADGQVATLVGTLSNEVGLPESVTPTYSKVDAAIGGKKAVAALVSIEGAGQMDTKIRLRISPADGLIWLVDVWSMEQKAFEYVVTLDATDGTLISVRSTAAAAQAPGETKAPGPAGATSTLLDNSEVKVGVLALKHKAGEQWTKAQESSQETVLASEPVAYDVVDANNCRVALRREGHNQPRIWNDLDLGTDTSKRVLLQRRYTVPCVADEALGTATSLSAEGVFANGQSDGLVGGLGAVLLGDREFNEQHVYLWAKRIKQHVDSWGREKSAKGITSHRYYPTLKNRRVQLEIVVNADNTFFCGNDANHGCIFTVKAALDELPASYTGVLRFKNSQLTDLDCDGVCSVKKWNQFYGDRYRAVAFVRAPCTDWCDGPWGPNHAGPSRAPTWAVIAHEIGHWVAWTYGYWSYNGEHNEGRPVNEALSSVFGAMFGKSFWKNNLGYEDSARVASGAEIRGDRGGYGTSSTERQWRHHDPNNAATLPLHNYQDICNEGSRAPWVNNSGDAQSYGYRYFLGWPFIQAMWALMNNEDPSAAAGEETFWATDADARMHTSDFLMNLLYQQTYTRFEAVGSGGRVSNLGADDPTFYDLATAMVARMQTRIERGIEYGFIDGYSRKCPGGLGCACDSHSDCTSNHCSGLLGSKGTCARRTDLRLGVGRAPNSVERVIALLDRHGLLTPCKTFEAPVPIHANLPTWIDERVSEFSGHDTNQYNKPSVAERASFRDAARLLLANELFDARLAAEKVDYKIVRFFDLGDDLTWNADDDEWYRALIPKDDNRDGRGFFFVRRTQTTKRALYISAPHPQEDSRTDVIAPRTFRATRARGLAIAGENRCSSTTVSGCSGTTSVCGGASEDAELYRISDVAHTQKSFFQVFHEEADATYGGTAMHLQIHGMSKLPAFSTSDGTTFDTLDPTHRSVVLMANLANEIAGSGHTPGTCCNVASMGHVMCGEWNTQGRYTNGVPHTGVCQNDASSTTGRFVHVELGPDIRDKDGAESDVLSPNQFYRAVQTTYPKL